MNHFGFVLGIFGLAGTVAIATQVLVEKPGKPASVLADAERPPRLTAKKAAPARPTPQLAIKQSPENFPEGLKEGATSFAIKTETAIPTTPDWLIREDESKSATADSGATFDPTREVDDLATSSIDKGAIAPMPLPLAPDPSTAQERTASPAIAPEQKPEPRRVEKPKMIEAAPKPRLTRSPPKKTSGHRRTRLAGTRTDESEARAFAQSVMRMQPTGSGFFVSSQFPHGSFGIRGF